DSFRVEPLSPMGNRSPFAKKNGSWSRSERKKRFNNFNRYVRGPLRESVLCSIGKEVDIPLSLCLICFLPLIFYSAVSVLGCDGDRCDVTAKQVGYATGSQYFVANSLSWVLGFGIIIPTTQPLLLRMVKVIVTLSKNVPVQVCCTVVSTFLAYLWVFSWQGLVTATMTTALFRETSPFFLLALAIQLILLTFQMWYLFFQPSQIQGVTLQEDCYTEF
ncbi:unnamed protein product, partial [Symbiodinium pilosum]